MTKRTKRYGEFRIGDKVQRKDGLFKDLAFGVVTDMKCGFIYTKWTDLRGQDFISTYSPNQLINLTRIEEENRKITDPLPPFPKGLAEELNKRCERYLKIINQDDFKPTSFEDFVTGLINEREEKLRKLAEQELCETYGVEFPIKDNPLLNLCPLPSPYTRDGYTSSKDFD